MTAAGPAGTIPFDPAPHVPILELPEGLLRQSPIARLFGRGERAYGPVWRYVRRVDRLRYLGQGAKVRFGEFDIGMRTPNRIPTQVDFAAETVFIGRKLTIPVNSLRGLLAAHGLMPGRTMPVFAILLKVDGCDRYLPLHRCVLDQAVTDLAEFLSQRLRIPLGVASRPLGFLIEPGAARIRHSAGETPLYEHRALLSVRDPEGRTAVRLLAGAEKVTLIDQPDPLGWLAGWGNICDELIGIVARRVKSKYGRDQD